MSIGAILGSLVRVLPRVRGPVQLAGFLFSIFAAALLQWVDPGDRVSLAISGTIGLALVAVPLAFKESILEHLPKPHRAPFLLALLLGMIAALLYLATFTFERVQRSMAAGALLDSKLKSAQTTSLPDGQHRVQLNFSLFPLQKVASTVFTGIVTLHDESRLAEGSDGKTDKSCSAIPSCIGYFLVQERVFVPAEGVVNYTVHIPVANNAAPMRIYWEFYQEEGDGVSKCQFRRDVPRIAEGVDPVAMFRGEVLVRDVCHVSMGTEMAL